MDGVSALWREHAGDDEFGEAGKSADLADPVLAKSIGRCGLRINNHLHGRGTKMLSPSTIRRPETSRRHPIKLRTPENS
jgi:hypothetical protein